MLTPRRVAQLSLSAACLTLVTCITVLVAGGGQDPASADRAVHPVVDHSHMNAVSASQFVSGDAHSPLVMAVK